MDKLKVLSAAVIGLFALNLATIGFLFFKQEGPDHASHRMPREVIIEKLHFDGAQQKQYDSLIHWHRQQIGNLERQIFDTKNQLYRLLQDNSPNISAKDSLTARLGQLQTQIENVHFRHFEDIRKICKPGQLQDYNALSDGLSRIFSHPKPGQ